MTTLSTVAQCAVAIRKDLKQAFPDIKFSVTSSSYSMGDSVRIRYVDGALISDVKEIVQKYQYGSFNGMEDYYDINNYNSAIPQTKYILVNREISEKAKIIIATKLIEKHRTGTIEAFLKNEKIDIAVNYSESGSLLIWKEFNETRF